MIKSNTLILALLTIFLTGIYGTEYEVQVDNANIHSGNKIIGHYPKGTKLTSTRTDGEWILVSFEDGNGWILAADLKKGSIPPPPTAKPDNSLSATVLNPKADEGKEYPDFEMAMKYAEGNRVRKDYTKAAKWFQKSAERGHTESQHKLGELYELGLGVRANYIQADKWYRLAAEKGHAASQFSLGEMYIKYALKTDKKGRGKNGRGDKENFREAEKWYRMAAKQGHQMAKLKVDSLHSTQSMKVDKRKPN